MKLLSIVDTIFKSLENSKTSDPHRLLLNHLHKIDLKRSDRYIALSNLKKIIQKQ